MTRPAPEATIAVLAMDLRPVRPLREPVLRAGVWMAAAGALAAGLAVVADLGQVHARLAAAPDLCWALAGSILTAGCAVLAAFELSVPGRPAWWLAVPVPPALLWLGASGWGCLRAWGVPGVAPADMHDAMGCVEFILGVSVPLSVLLLLMLRRACPLWPARTAAMAGLAAAAGAAALLTLFHEHDASVVDLLLHMVAVAMVMGASRLAGAVIL